MSHLGFQHAKPRQYNLGVCDGRLPTCRSVFELFATAAQRRTGDFNAQGLANTAWAFATAGVPHAELFEVLAKAAERRAGDFGAQELANIDWALAKADLPDAELFEVLAHWGLQRAGPRQHSQGVCESGHPNCPAAHGGLLGTGLTDTAWALRKRANDASETIWLFQIFQNCPRFF